MAEATTPDLSQLTDDQLQSLSNQAAAFPDGSAPAVLPPIQAIQQIESSGASDTADVPNSASSAAGSMQVLKGTRADPGFGVKPSNGTATDDARVGRDYYGALQNKYNDPQTAALAYSWGPGNVDKWVKNGGDLSKLPDEQLNYLNKFQSLTGLGNTAPTNATSTDSSDDSNTGDTPLFERMWDGATSMGNSVVDGASAAIQHPVDYYKGLGASVANNAMNLGKMAINTDASTADPMNGIGGYDDDTKAGVNNAVANAQITAGPNNNPTAFNAGQFVGNAAQSAALGAAIPEIKAAQGAPWLMRALGYEANHAVQGGVQASASTALDGGSPADVGKNFLTGAAANMILGPATHGALSAVKPIVAKVIGAKAATAAADQAATDAGNATGGAFSDAEKNMAGKVAGAINADGSPQTAENIAAEMTADRNQSRVPGYQPTAAETTQNPTVQALQTGLDNSTDNSGLSARTKANRSSNTDFVNSGATTDSDLAAQRQSFQDSQDALAAQGNQQVPPVSAADAAPTGTFGAPAMQKNLGRANALAQNDGSDVIQQAFDQPNADMVNAWQNGIAGSEAKSAALESARTMETSPMYQDALNSAPNIALDHDTASLVNTPAMQSALRNVETLKGNIRDTTPVIQDVPARAPDGNVYAQSIAPHDLNMAKMHLDDYIQRMSNPQDAASADKWMRNSYIGLRNNINNILENRIPGFKEANAHFAARSDQLAESQFLTHPNMVDQFNTMRVAKLDNLIKETEAGQANNNPFDKAKTVSAAKLAQMRQFRDDLVATANHRSAHGLQGDAFNYLRQAAEKDPVAAQMLQEHLSANSPAYQQFYADHVAGNQALTHQQNYNALADRVARHGDGNVTWNDVNKLHEQTNDFSPENVARLNAVRDTLQRFESRNDFVQNARTANNLAKRDGFDQFVQAERGGGLGNLLASEGGQKAVSTLLGAKVFSAIPLLHKIPVLGPLAVHGTEALGSGLAKVGGRMLGGDTVETLAAKTAQNRDAIENLLLNPKRLSDAMGAVSKADADKAVINDNLLAKMATVKHYGGLLGAIAQGQAIAGSNRNNGK